MSPMSMFARRGSQVAAESSEDRAVDVLIDGLQSTLDKLKSAQRKDVDDETKGDGEYAEPKNLQEAGRKAYRLLKAPKKGE